MESAVADYPMVYSRAACTNIEGNNFKRNRICLYDQMDMMKMQILLPNFLDL